jgi:4-aminobutyrate aminotransferase-like enzyme
MGPNLPTFYEEPIHIVKGEGVWLWDAEGNKYLDCYNNVPHVGHCNPRVVEAVSKQLATLNTHTRYFHDLVLDYIEKLTGTMDDFLDTAILTCTGSEANDIALRMAEGMTGKRGIIVTDATYHGNTSLVSQLGKEYKPKVGFGLGQYVRYVKAPDSYRMPDPDGRLFAARVAEQIAALEKDGVGFATLIVCPYFFNEAFTATTDGWLKPVAEVVKKAGGLLICDEVQSGFGRMGTHFWAHQKMGVVPDVMTLGKPMANGMPVGGVVTNSDILANFRTNFRYFNTFGGNPVSCTAAMAVLDELLERDLMSHAKSVGDYARARMAKMQEKYDIIADIRGSGMVFGAELLLNKETKEPATEFTTKVLNKMRHRRVLHTSLGPYRCTLKIRPPMVFENQHVDLLMDTLDEVMEETLTEMDHPAHGAVLA